MAKSDLIDLADKHNVKVNDEDTIKIIKNKLHKAGVSYSDIKFAEKKLQGIINSPKRGTKIPAKKVNQSNKKKITSPKRENGTFNKVEIIKSISPKREIKSPIQKVDLVKLDKSIKNIYVNNRNTPKAKLKNDKNVPKLKNDKNVPKFKNDKNAPKPEFENDKNAPEPELENDLYEIEKEILKNEENKKKKIIKDTNNLSFDIIKFPKLKNRLVKINYEIFKKLHEDENFISNLRNSISKFLKYKLRKYAEIKINNQVSNLFSPKLLNDIEVEIKKKIISLNNLSKDFYDAIYDPDKGLETLGGRNNIKDMIANIIYAFSKNPNFLKNNFINFALYGKAGTGKTLISNIMAFAFNKFGIVSYSTPFFATYPDLITKSVGGTASKTLETLVKSLERVLFIDEAYQIAPCGKDGKLSDDSNSIIFTNESIAEMVKFMDKNMGLYITIVAGYENVMKNCYMKINEGLPRRFPNVIILKDYSDEELSRILIKNILISLLDQNFTISKEESDYIYSLVVYFNKNYPNIFLNQAGDMLNLSNNIVKAISSAYESNWINDNFENNAPFIYEGFQEFLNLRENQK